jgi:hypothetical protein
MRIKRGENINFYFVECPWQRACPESGLPHMHPYSSNARGLGGYTEGPQILNFREETNFYLLLLFFQFSHVALKVAMAT